jgi:hypothetical protein
VTLPLASPAAVGANRTVMVADADGSIVAPDTTSSTTAKAAPCSARPAGDASLLFSTSRPRRSAVVPLGTAAAESAKGPRRFHGLVKAGTCAGQWPCQQARGWAGPGRDRSKVPNWGTRRLRTARAPALDGFPLWEAPGGTGARGSGQEHGRGRDVAGRPRRTTDRRLRPGGQPDPRGVLSGIGIGIGDGQGRTLADAPVGHVGGPRPDCDHARCRLPSHARFEQADPARGVGRA